MYTNTVELIVAAIKPIIEIVIRKILYRKLSFKNDVLGWFNKCKLEEKKHKPFIADAIRIPGLYEALNQEPKKEAGILIGTYNVEDDIIDNSTLIEADGIDVKTRYVLGGEPIVILN